MSKSRLITLVVALAIAAVSYLGTPPGGDQGASPTSSSQAQRGNSNTIAEASLPVQAKQTLTLIRQGGPFPYKKDGTVFQNREKRLPQKERGYYREYTVDTPGLNHRGARRIVAGGPRKAPNRMYYTDDHYDSFRLIAEDDR
ncbi:MAG: ribonuclease domain-containing protein [Burkholderiaceae bacterium]